jgi:hypothetical protein
MMFSQVRQLIDDAFKAAAIDFPRKSTAGQVWREQHQAVMDWLRVRENQYLLIEYVLNTPLKEVFTSMMVRQGADLPKTDDAPIAYAKALFGE